MRTYDWNLVERLLHEVQNGAGRSFTPRPYAEQHAAAQAAQGQPVGDLDHLKTRACEYEKLLFERAFIETRPEQDGGNGENFVLTQRGSRLLSLIDSSFPGEVNPRDVLDQQEDALDEATFDRVAANSQIAHGVI